MARVFAFATVSVLLFAGLICAEETLPINALQQQCSEKELTAVSKPRALLQTARSIGRSGMMQSGSARHDSDSRPSEDTAPAVSQGELANASHNVTASDVDQLLAANNLLTAGGFSAPVLAEAVHFDEKTNQEGITVPPPVSAIPVLLTTMPPMPSIDHLTLPPPIARPPSPALPSAGSAGSAYLLTGDSWGALAEGLKVDKSADFPRNVEREADEPKQAMVITSRSNDPPSTGTAEALSVNKSLAFSGVNFSEAYAAGGYVSDDFFAGNFSVEKSRSQQSYARRLDKIGTLVKQAQHLQGRVHEHVSQNASYETEVANVVGINLTNLQGRTHGNASENASYETDVRLQLAIGTSHLAGINSTDSYILTNLQGRANASDNALYETELANMVGINLTDSPILTDSAKPLTGRFKKLLNSKMGKQTEDKLSVKRKQIEDSAKPLTGTFKELLKEAEESDLNSDKKIKPIADHSFLGKLGLHPAQACCCVVLVIVFTMLYSKMYKERYAYTW